MASTVLHDVWHATWMASTSSPIIGTLFVLSLAVVAGKVMRAVVHAGYPVDPTREFSPAEQVALVSRAARRCEHLSLLRGRCPESGDLLAAHVHPWSHGGQTDVANGQALCPRHRSSGDRIPFGWQLRRLERYRKAYYPGGVTAAVVRHGRVVEDHRPSRSPVAHSAYPPQAPHSA